MEMSSQLLYTTVYPQGKGSGTHTIRGWMDTVGLVGVTNWKTSVGNRSPVVQLGVNHFPDQDLPAHNFL